MDPVSVGLLAALAGGVGGELGRQSWASLSALVRRPFNRSGRGDDEGVAPAVSTGEGELAALEESPGDAARAHALSTALAVRSAVDPGFGTALHGWAEQARLVRTGDGEVHNEISGGTQHGPVLQARDVSGGLTFNSLPTPPHS